MLRPVLFRLDFASSAKRYCSFLSNSFNNIINETPRFLEAKTSFTESIDVFLDRENRHLDILDKLLKLRKQKESSTVPLFPSVIVKQLLDTTNSQDLLMILCNRLDYGIFLDPYVSCWLLNDFINKNNYKDASKLAVEATEQNIVQNELCNTLALKAMFEYLKILAESPQNEHQQEKVEPSDEIKVRVNFIRNYEAKDPNDYTEKKILGRSLLKICSFAPEADVQINFRLLAHLLCDQTSEFRDILQSQNPALCKDVLELCLLFVKNTTSEVNSDNLSALQTALKSTLSEANMTDKIIQYIHIYAKKEEPQLISKNKKALQEWTERFENCLKTQIELKKHQTRLENIDHVMHDLSIQRQKLWYFENKNDIDIQIFNKKVYYPKKWFGKKKKPKTIDNFYVPPEIIRKHN